MGDKRDSEVVQDSVDSHDFSNNSVSAKPGVWTRFKDSFKPAEVDEKAGDDLALTDDLESGAMNADGGQKGESLKRGLKQRHIQMIAIGGSIGTGLFVGSGGSLRTGGPAALLIAWGLVLTMLVPVVMSLGELCVAFPVTGSFSTYAVRFISPLWGFSIGVIYALMWLIVFPLELVALAMCILYWNDKINPVAWVSLFYVFIIAINLFGVKGYGEAEYFLTIVKIIAITGFIILGVVLVCGGGPTHEFIGAKYYHNPGAFAHGFKGVATTFVTALYSMAGAEMVGLASAETKNPQKVLPKAVRQVFIRLVLFYLLTLMFIGFLVPYNDPQLLGSNTNSTLPFVIAIKNAKIYALPSIFNACILFTVVLVGNLAVYGCLRTLHSLGEQGLLPRIFGYIDRRGRPMVALATLAIFGALCFLSAYENQGEVFAWMLSVLGLATVFVWFNIALCHVRVRWALYAQGRSTLELLYKAPTGIIGSIYAMGFLLVVLVLQFWSLLWPIGHDGRALAYSFFQAYLCAPIMLVLFVGHNIYIRRKLGRWVLLIPLKEVDLDTGRRQMDMDIIRAEIQQEKDAMALKPFYVRWFKYWC